MSVTLQLELLLGSVCLLAVIFYMLKKNLLSVKYSLLWLFFAAALILFAAVPYVVYVLRDILNIEIPVNLVFVLLFCFVLLVIFGMFMDGTSIAVLLVPLLWPVAKELGIDVIHFGIVFCILNSLGCCTPPVAVNLFGMANISGLSVGEVTKGEMPFFIANLCVVLLIIFVPAVTAWVVG